MHFLFQIIVQCNNLNWDDIYLINPIANPFSDRLDSTIVLPEMRAADSASSKKTHTALKPNCCFTFHVHIIKSIDNILCTTRAPFSFFLFSFLFTSSLHSSGSSLDQCDQLHQDCAGRCLKVRGPQSMKVKREPDI